MADVCTHPRRVVVDCDPGIDDAIALHVVADAARRNVIDVRGVVTVVGNAPLDMATRNAAFLSGELGLAAPVRAGSGAPLDGGSPAQALHIHGTDGIGGACPAAFAARCDDDGVAWLAETVREAHRRSERLTLLALGPLTNIAALVSAHAAHLDAIERIIIMGGAFWRGGNVTPHAEFNFYIDPRAAAVVCASAVPLTIVPLDVTHRVVITSDDVDGLAARGASALSRDLLAASIENHRAIEGIDGCYMHDALAAALIESPGLVSTRTGTVTIDLDGETAGRSAFTADPAASIQVAAEVNVAAARDTILRALAPGAEGGTTWSHGPRQAAR